MGFGLCLVTRVRMRLLIFFGFTTLFDNHIRICQLVWSDFMVHTTRRLHMEFILSQGQVFLLLFCPSNVFSFKDPSATVILHCTMCFAHWWPTCNYSSFRVGSVWHRVDVQKLEILWQLFEYPTPCSWDIKMFGFRWLNQNINLYV